MGVLQVNILGQSGFSLEIPALIVSTQIMTTTLILQMILQYGDPVSGEQLPLK